MVYNLQESFLPRGQLLDQLRHYVVFVTYGLYHLQVSQQRVALEGRHVAGLLVHHVLLLAAHLLFDGLSLERLLLRLRKLIPLGRRFNGLKLGISGLLALTRLPDVLLVFNGSPADLHLLGGKDPLGCGVVGIFSLFLHLNLSAQVRLH